MTTSQGSTKARASESMRSKSKHLSIPTEGQKQLWKIDQDLEQGQQEGRPKRKLTRATRFVPGSGDCNADYKTGYGFTCPYPTCDTLCSYDDKVCPGCKKGCAYRPGVGRVMTEDRPSNIYQRSRSARVPRNSRLAKAPTKSAAKTPFKEPVEAQAKDSSKAPGKDPSEVPSGALSRARGKVPAKVPSDAPAGTPAETPAKTPAKAPAEAPTKDPADDPAKAYGWAPADSPADAPADATNGAPADAPTDAPGKAPSEAPSKAHAKAPGEVPPKAPANASPIDGLTQKLQKVNAELLVERKNTEKLQLAIDILKKEYKSEVRGLSAELDVSYAKISSIELEHEKVIKSMQSDFNCRESGYLNTIERKAKEEHILNDKIATSDAQVKSLNAQLSKMTSERDDLAMEIEEKRANVALLEAYVTSLMAERDAAKAKSEESLEGVGWPKVEI